MMDKGNKESRRLPALFIYLWVMALSDQRFYQQVDGVFTAGNRSVHHYIHLLL
ncbi:hypothetical protein [Aeromonas bestiarum]|uniref:hypothetical protein n=1 Tax=Aeromonas bestiarum TaxID=105751 RepID=UPI000A8E764C|nr:hypothetical protein [Aeromonas bestiarum]